ncbi:MAG: preprotein translocase subunit YajC [Coriobacteriia bacterium]|nr:preprotein translocase subunit YajC [Coriobacteriia bacterium]
MQGSGGLIYLGVLVIAFYLLIIRPQMQRTKQTRELMASLVVGDRVVTIGGLHGSIVSIEGTVVTLRVADGVELHFEKSAIARKDTGTKAPAGSDSPGEDVPFSPGSPSE